MLFKSGGIVVDGTPFIGKISAADAKSNKAPVGFKWKYKDTKEYIGSAKMMRVDSEDNVYAILGTDANVVKLDKYGKVVAKSKELAKTSQITDLELVDGGVVLVGLKFYPITEDCHGDGCTSILSHMIKLDSSFKFEWAEDHGNYKGGLNQFTGLEKGNAALINNECWGISKTFDKDSTHNGYALACGTGIEECSLDNMDKQLYETCTKDPRQIWRALTIATDLSGKRIWSRMDNHQNESGDPNFAWNSASEYIYTNSNGKSTMITDEAMGFGFATFDVYTNTTCKTEETSVEIPEKFI